jgi:hypothetical protein
MLHKAFCTMILAYESFGQAPSQHLQLQMNVGYHLYYFQPQYTKLLHYS